MSLVKPRSSSNPNLPRGFVKAGRRLCAGALAVLLWPGAISPASSQSVYTRKLTDPKAVYVEPSGTADDTAALQQAVDRVQETTGQGIVFLAPGQYRLRDTLYIWPGIRLIGCGAERPVLVLPANTPGFIHAGCAQGGHSSTPRGVSGDAAPQAPR